MRQTVTILRVEGENALVYREDSDACDRDCAGCAGGCGALISPKRVEILARNSIGAGPGDRVMLETASAPVYWAMVLIFVLPVALFFLGYGIGSHWNAGLIFGGLGFLAGVTGAVLAGRRRELAFEITGYADGSTPNSPG